ncbi:hypothetical protein JMJ77_0006607 [Colletotrichum scovillei]|uniref:Uncharacterized protein n=1 Tax=Colletotrichum scovillei TaxID=1209932 RepID=A0A9P7RIY5_9PEZI|nr:hypothetical protein JMJ77_0006607 [Colletotrichum scovillei]KAG7077788.1 hypothetical protein JMJ76_0015030 [Colletotrichum scovillei]KAG7084908.1 hypothetical protein JMJ78_0010338 [Colletotrichum scovillei]
MSMPHLCFDLLPKAPFAKKRRAQPKSGINFRLSSWLSATSQTQSQCQSDSSTLTTTAH